jgi:hypothetical protein
MKENLQPRDDNPVITPKTKFVSECQLKPPPAPTPVSPPVRSFPSGLPSTSFAIRHSPSAEPPSA